MDPTFEALFALLPAHWVPYVYAAFAFVGAISVLILPFKNALEKWASPEWRVRLDVVFIVLDWLAVNSKPMRDRPWKETNKA